MLKFAILALALAQTSALAETKKIGDPLDKVRCKRLAETGSLAKVTKICRTERQWREIRDAGRNETRQMLDAAGSNRTSG